MSQNSPPLPRPFDARMLNVGDGHWIYVEEVGKRGGRPCLFIHGGPGSGAQHSQRDLFDPERDHAFLFDQRGAGRSHPYLSCKANTTTHLVADIEAIRMHFNIDKWLLVGGSWGSTLALAYAETFPEHVSGIVLRAVFLGTREEVEWAFVEGPKRFRPELYEDFVGSLPSSEDHDPLGAYIRRLTDPASQIHAPAAYQWNAYERVLSELEPDQSRLPGALEWIDKHVPPTPVVEAHYIANNFFLEPNQLLNDAHKLANIPGHIVQGRYDLLCPPKTAYALSQAWKNCQITFIDRAGHAMTEPGVTEKMTEIISKMP